MKITALLLLATGLRVHKVWRSVGAIWLCVRAPRPTASCPLCGRRSRRVQSTYVRTLTDVPISGEPVVLRLQVRCFVCETPSCPRRIFAERFPGLAAPRARQTDRARAACERVAYALGGRAGVEPCS